MMRPSSSNQIHDLAYYSRGMAHFEKGEYDRAIADYGKAIELGLDGAVIYDNRGDAYFNKQEYDRAIEDYGRAIEIDPNLASAYNGRGFAYLREG